MKSNTRMCVAYLAGRLIKGSDATAVCGAEGTKPVGLDDLLDSGVRMYRQNGNPRRGGRGFSFKVMFHEEGHYVDLSINGSVFRGYDFGADCFFAGEVKEDAVCLYDFGALARFQYRLCSDGARATQAAGSLYERR
jgi:hypothetical protein